jgi:hypothetical protein
LVVPGQSCIFSKQTRKIQGSDVQCDHVSRESREADVYPVGDREGLRVPKLSFSEEVY